MHFAGKVLALWQSISRPTLQWAVRGGGQWLMVGWVQHTVQLVVPTPPSYFCRLFQCVTPGPHFMTQLLWPGDFVTVALWHLGYTFFLGGGKSGVVGFLPGSLFFQLVGGFLIPPQTNDLWEWQYPRNHFPLFNHLDSLKHSFFMSGWELFVINYLYLVQGGPVSPENWFRVFKLLLTNKLVNGWA